MAEPSSSGDQLADGGFLEEVLPDLATPDEMARASTSRIPPENLQASARWCGGLSTAELARSMFQLRVE